MHMYVIRYVTKETIGKSENKKEERRLGRANVVLFHQFSDHPIIYQ